MVDSRLTGPGSSGISGSSRRPWPLYLLVCRAALRWYEAERQRWNDCFILVHVLADQVPDGVL